MNIQHLTPDEELNIKNATTYIPEIKLQGHIKVCKVVSVSDDDTIKACFYHNNIINKWNIRFFGVDTHELIPSRKLLNRDIEIENAKSSRDYLKSILLTLDENKQSKLFYIKCYGFDKYGSILGEIFEYQPILFQHSDNPITNITDNKIGNDQSNIYPGLHPSSINSFMIRQGYAKYYDGCKKNNK